MRNSVFFVLAMAFVLLSFKDSGTIDLIDIQKSKKVELTIKGNEGSTHYLKPVKVILKNNSLVSFDVSIPAGLHFETIDPGIQDIISTQSQVLALAPGEEKEVEINGVCIQANNSSPGKETKFTLSKYADDKMLKLAQYLDEKDLTNSQAQQAMWVLSDKRSPVNIIGFDDENEQELMNVTTDLAGLPRIDKENYEEVKKAIIEPVYKSSLKGYFKFQFPKKTKVHIAVFNQDHVLIKEVFNAEVDKGFHKIDYQLETTQYEGQKIYSQMIAYDKVVAKRSIDLRSRDSIPHR